MMFTTENSIFIKYYRLDKNMALDHVHEFQNKPWSASGLDKLIKKIDDTVVQTVLMIMIVVGLNY